MVAGEVMEDAASWLYRYVWGNTVERKAMKGRICKVLSRGIVYEIEFCDNGERAICPMRALRRIYEKKSCTK